MYFAIFLLSGLLGGSAAEIFGERVLYIESFDYAPCEVRQQNGTYDFTLLDFDVRVTNSGNIHFTGSFMININVTSPLKVTVKLWRTIIGFPFWIPCFGAFGSCSILDMCRYIGSAEEECPLVQDEIDYPCKCPIEPGIYKLPGVYITDMAKTKWAYLFSGYYIAMITLYQGDKIMTCYKIDFTLE